MARHYPYQAVDHCGMSWLTQSPITRLAYIIDGIVCVSSVFRLFLDLTLSKMQRAHFTCVLETDSYRIESRRSDP